GHSQNSPSSSQGGPRRPGPRHSPTRAGVGPGVPAPGITLLSVSADLEFTVRVLLYALIFLLSVFGNSLIILVLVLNRRLRTVTNSFLLSLALSDLLLALCCMPFTLVPSLMGTFIFGPSVCKLVAYLMSECRQGWELPTWQVQG
uniref:G-protein coupled receptors family 1 profile domain-containing protein n=1 Tax=Gopherus agassizii TaxID=38772 RepID=A0A452GM35_9SAUR